MGGGVLYRLFGRLAGENYTFTALAEPLAYDFCTDYLAALRADGIRFVNVNGFSAWIARMGNNWSGPVVIKVTRALLA